MTKYYPAFLDIEGRKCVVVGGGEVAARKAASLAHAGAKVMVVSPNFCSRLSRLAEKRAVTLERRRFRARDLDEAFLAFACTSDRKVNDMMHDAARRRGVLVNVVDSKTQCDFIVPSVVSRGSLQIAVSTSGVSPALARVMREELQKRYGPRYADFLALMAKFREEIARKVPRAPERKRIFELLTEDKFVGEFVKKGKRDGKRLFQQKMKELLPRAGMRNV